MDRTANSSLATIGLGSAESVRLAAALGLDADHAGSGNRPEVVVVAYGLGEGLENALSSNARLVVEASKDGRVPSDLEGRRRDAQGVTLSVTTATALHHDLAAIVRKALIARGSLPPDRADDVELALHEVVCNAVTHGNLAMEGGRPDDPVGFFRFFSTVDERLRDPVIGERRVTIVAEWPDGELCLSVQDEGSGYDPLRLRPSAPGSKSGRGLSIARALASEMTVLEGGRRTVLRFRP